LQNDEPPQPAEEEEPLWSCFGDGVSVMSPCQVLSDVDTEEPEAADSLHRSPIDGDGGVSLSLLLPVIHNQLLGFADVEMEVVIKQLRFPQTLFRAIFQNPMEKSHCFLKQYVIPAPLYWDDRHIEESQPF